MSQNSESEWLSPELEELACAIALLNEKYVEAVADLQEQAPGSERFLQRWAELDVLLEWLKKKIEAAQREIARIEQTWPG